MTQPDIAPAFKLIEGDHVSAQKTKGPGISVEIKLDDTVLPAGIDEQLTSQLYAGVVPMLMERLENEFDNFIEAYRRSLRDSMFLGEDPALVDALEKVALQEDILASAPMADNLQACRLLGLSGSNASSAMGRIVKKGDVFRMIVDGRPAYPLFQFDIENRRIFPVIKDMLTMRPDRWSDFRFLNWFIRPLHALNGSPADSLNDNPEGVMAAFKKAIEKPRHG